jgi:predicted O-methyltransferase YrrM
MGLFSVASSEIKRQDGWYDRRSTRRYAKFQASSPQFIEAKKRSMLHAQTLALITYFANHARGGILELGPYLGAATALIATEVARSGNGPFVSIELGGVHEHDELPSQDIFADCRRYLTERGVIEHVHLINGHSGDPATVEQVNKIFRGTKIDLLIIDADGQVERDMVNFAPLLMDGCVLVIDDYESKIAPEKAVTVKPWVDQAVREGRISKIGLFPWSTWVGQVGARPTISAMKRLLQVVR